MADLNIAVIGCGRMGKMHITNLQQNSNINIAAVIDPTPDHTWLNLHHIETVATDCNAVMQDKSIDAVVIAAPSSEHVQLIEQAAVNGKHIFCEKPVALSIQGIQRAIGLVKKHKVKLQVGFNRRFDPCYTKVKNALQNGEAGNCYSVRMTNRDPKRPDLNFIPRSGGLFLDFSVHDFDMLRFVTGCEVSSVQAFGSNIIDSQIGELGDIDTAVISCQLTDGTLASIDLSREAVYGYDQRLEVLGSKGSIEAQNHSLNTVSISKKDCIETSPLKYSFVERYHDAYILQMQAFFDYICSDNKPSPANLDDALRAVACCIAAQKSFDEDREVELQEIL